LKVLLELKITRTRITGISMPGDLYERLEKGRGSISRSRFYRDLVLLGLKTMEGQKH